MYPLKSSLGVRVRRSDIVDFLKDLRDDGRDDDNDEDDHGLGKTKVYVTQFLAQLRDGGQEGRDNGKEGRITVISAVRV